MQKLFSHPQALKTYLLLSTSVDLAVQKNLCYFSLFISTFGDGLKMTCSAHMNALANQGNCVCSAVGYCERKFRENIYANNII